MCKCSIVSSIEEKNNLAISAGKRPGAPSGPLPGNFKQFLHLAGIFFVILYTEMQCNLLLILFKNSKRFLSKLSCAAIDVYSAVRHNAFSEIYLT
jgi:hypothetical protein